MKNYTKLIGIIAFVAVIGFSMAFLSCDEEKDELDGTTWKASETQGGATVEYVITFASPNFTMTYTYAGQTKDAGSGTYSISGSEVTLTLKGEDGEEQSQTGTLSGNTLKIGDTTFTKQ